MNYGKYEAERRLKSLHSKSGKYASRLLLNIFKYGFDLFDIRRVYLRRYLSCFYFWQ